MKILFTQFKLLFTALLFAGIFLPATASAKPRVCLPEKNEHHQLQADPDLWIRNASGPLQVKIGTQYSYVSVMEFFTGIDSSRAHSMYLYLSADTILDSSDPVISSAYCNQLMPGDSALYFISFDVPAFYSNQPGDYYLIFRDNPDLVQEETNLSNNTAFVPITLLQTDIDLRMQIISVGADTIKQGHAYEVSFVETNFGTDTAFYHSSFLVLSSDTIYDSTDYNISYIETDPFLAPGSSRAYQFNVSFPNDLPLGDRYLLLVDNPFKELPETNLSNNNAFLRVTVVVPSTDLQVHNLTIPSSSLYPGENTSVTFENVNIGQDSATYGWVNLYLSADTIYDGYGPDTYLGSYSSGGVTGNGVEQGTIYFTVPSDLVIGQQYYLMVKTDDYQYVLESNENNNVAFIPVTIRTPDLDLLGRNLILTPDTIQAGGNLYYSFDVVRRGSDPTPFFYEGVYLSADTIFDSLDVNLTYGVDFQPYDTIRSYSTASFGIGHTLHAGRNYVLLVSDVFNWVHETDESNNTTYAPLTIIIPDVDLQVRNAKAFQHLVAGGKLYQATAEDINTGTETSFNSYGMALYLSSDTILDPYDQILVTQYPSINPLAPGDTAKFTFNFTISSSLGAGDRFLLFSDNYAFTQGETNYNNNTMFVPVTIRMPDIDLMVQNLQTANHDTLFKGLQYELSYLESNFGTDTSYGHNGYLFLSADSLFDYSDRYITNINMPAILSPGGSQVSQTSFYLPTDIPSGNYKLLLYDDFDNNPPDTNVTNNVAFTSVYIKTPMVDLQVRNINIASPQLVAGQPYTVSYENVNAGPDPASYSYSVLYWSTDTIYDASDLYAGYYNSNGVAGNSSEQVTIPFTTPSDAALGNYYLILVDDQYQYVSETNENNNTGWIAVSIIPNDVDLSVRNFNITPHDLVPGMNFDLSFEEVNTGSMPAAFHYNSVYMSKDTILDSTDVHFAFLPTYGIPADSSFAITYTFSGTTFYGITDFGKYYMIFNADDPNYVASNYIAETNESNNTAYVEFNLLAPDADLVIVNQTLTYSQEQWGTLVNLSFEDKNQGTTPAMDHNLGFYFSTDTILDPSDLNVYTWYNNLLAGDSSRRSSFSFYLSAGIAPGRYYILYADDIYNQVAETNEGNNVAYMPIRIFTPTYDVKIRNISLPATESVGSIVNTSFEDHNKGTLTASNYYIGLFLSSDSLYDGSDIPLNYVYANPLIKDSSYVYNLSYTVPQVNPGNYYVLYVDDVYNMLTETDENNTRYKKVTITPPNVDLKVQSLSLSATSVISGNSLFVSNNIKNAGIDPSTYTYTNYYLSADTILDNSDLYLSSYYNDVVPGLGFVFDSLAVTIPSSTAAGTYYILVKADGLNYQVETNENNNVSHKQLIVKAAVIDLSVKAPSVDIVKPVAGSVVQATCTIANSGNVNASYNYIGYYLSKDASVSSDDIFMGTFSINGMLAKSSAIFTNSLTIPNVSAGSYYILFVADVYNYVNESDETNNVNKQAITVKAGAARTGALSVSPYLFNVSIAPNPVVDDINIILEGVDKDAEISIRLTDLLGNNEYVVNTVVQQDKITIPGSGIISGVYLLVVEYEGVVKVLRVVKS